VQCRGIGSIIGVRVAASEKKQLSNLSLEQRVARLEGALGWGELGGMLSPVRFLIAIALMGCALGISLRGLKVPNHSYQMVIGIGAVLIAYHRGWLLWPQKFYQWVLGLLNAAVLAVLLKLVIGGGNRAPFFWFKVPTISAGNAKNKWIPSWDLNWEATTFSDWSVDFTVIQTFLLVVTLIGALFRFQPFVSMTALLLVLCSIPALTEFEWNWVFPALMVGALGFYVQVPSQRKV